MANTRSSQNLGSAVGLPPAADPREPGGRSEAPPPALRALVAADYRLLSRKRRWALSIFGGLCAAAVAMVAMLYPGHPGRESALSGVIIGLQGLSGLLLVSAALGWPSLGRAGVLRVVAAVSLFGTALLVPLIDRSLPLAHADLGAGLNCLLHGALYALILAAAVALLARRLLRRHAPVSLMLGMGTAQIVWGPLHLMCRHNDAAHLMIWHALVPPVTFLVAWWVHRLWRKATAA